MTFASVMQDSVPRSVGAGVSTNHASFLKRNGVILAKTLDVVLPPVRQARVSLLDELTILVATDHVSSLLDGRSRGALIRMLNHHPPSARLTWARDRWKRQIEGRSCGVPNASQRISAMYKVLGRRVDFPELAAMRNWGYARWRSFFRKLGCSPRLAGAVTALILDRNEMPSGPRTTQVYRRLGYRCGPAGRPGTSQVFEKDIPTLKWRLQQLADLMCTPEIVPGGRTCRACPVRRFCKAYRETRSEMPNGRPTFVDLFAGPGGLSLGMSRAGMRLLVAVENEQHAADTLYLNHPEAGNGVVVRRDVRTILRKGSLVEKLRGVDLLVGGPPCQAWSIARRHSRADTHHPSRHLVRQFVQAAEILTPRIAIMENVPGLRNADNGSALQRTLSAFSGAGFAVQYLELNAADFGVPQNRRRVFFFAVNRTRFEDANRVLTQLIGKVEEMAGRRARSKVREAISGLPQLAAGDGGLVMRRRRRGRVSRYAQRLASDESLVFNHQARAHNIRDLEIFEDLRWGEVAWQYEERKPGRIPYQLDSFADKYRKIHPHRQSPTIPCHLHRDANSYVHPFESRGITPREAARFQSFPDDYIFLGGQGPSFIQIGNAVPPLLAESLGRAILRVLS